MHDEEADGQRNDEQAFLQQGRIGNLALGIEPHDLLLEIRLRVELLAVNRDEHELYEDEDQDCDAREIGEEIHEVQANSTADHDVRRVADQRCRAADVRGQDLRDQVRFDIDLELCRDAERDWHGQQDRRDVVEEGRADHRQR